MAGETGGFGGDAFHQIAVADDAIGKVIDDFESRPIVARGQVGLRDRHADAVAEALTQRSRRSLDARSQAALRMAGRAAVPLAELFDLLERQIVAGQMEHAVEQHRAVTGGQDKAVAIRPRGIARIMFQEAGPQDIGRRRQSHRRARMTGLRLFHGIHGKHANGIDAELIE